jgi:long-subunit acyl-CoA synthetase (AMP-forming)
MNFALLNGYGMTETTAPQHIIGAQTFRLEKEEDYHTVGSAVPAGQTKIHKAKPDDEEGEVCMRGRNVCMGYLNNPEACALAFDEEGFLHSGDLGKLN